MAVSIVSEGGGTRAMTAARDRVVTVFGGTGFLGRRIVRHLRLHGFLRFFEPSRVQPALSSTALEMRLQPSLRILFDPSKY